MLYVHIPADNRNLLTMVDHFSKFGWVVPIPNKKSQTVLDAIKLWFALHGKPDSLQSDNGTEFANSTLKTYLEKEGVNHIQSLHITHKVKVLWKHLLKLYLSFYILLMMRIMTHLN